MTGFTKLLASDQLVVVCKHSEFGRFEGRPERGPYMAGVGDMRGWSVYRCGRKGLIG
jgi:hypothetical protein